MKLNSFLDYFKNKKLQFNKEDVMSDINLQKPQRVNRKSGNRTPISPYSNDSPKLWLSASDSQKV